ncbi:MAG TPA: MlaD family protein [Verrucomicrobiae bacterium]|jgi:paraquat-inducible protein B
MSQKANPTYVGLFFVTGLALSLAGLLLFSARSLFHQQNKDILYFNASLKGLNPGAPVKFRGVTIGSVIEIMIRHNQAPEDFAMPVIIAIDKKLAQSKSDDQLQIGSLTALDDLSRRGFRGRLEAESLVTGVLYVALDIVPNAPSPVFHQLKPEYHEIPTVPSEIQQLMSGLAHVDIHGLAEKLTNSLTRIDTKLGQLDVVAINADITNLLESANSVVRSKDLTNSLTSFRKTLDNVEALVKHVDSRVDPLVDSATNTLVDAREALASLQSNLRNLSSLLGPDSALRPNLVQALEGLSDASRAVADLAEFVKRNPNALLVGRKAPKEIP